MGMFDTVHVQCPICKINVPIQSKAGECILGDYFLYDAPPKILLDLDKETQTCSKGHKFYIRVQSIVHGVSIPGECTEES